MAEIRVRPKRRSLWWLWVLLALAVMAAVAWYLNANGVTVLRFQRTGIAPASAPRLLLWS